MAYFSAISEFDKLIGVAQNRASRCPDPVVSGRSVLCPFQHAKNPKSAQAN
jgi:hypothetical protein